MTEEERDALIKKADLVLDSTYNYAKYVDGVIPVWYDTLKELRNAVVDGF